MPCRLVSPQCGCGVGQGCYLSGSARTCAVAGTGALGVACTTVNDCAPGFGCLGISADASRVINQCYTHCDVDGDCPAGSICGGINDATGMPISGAGACSVGCDLGTGGGCVAGGRCTAYQETGGTMRWYTDCVGPVGAGGRGAACTNVLDCQAGYACVGMTCLPWCQNPGVIGTAGGCRASEACYGFTSPITIGGASFGVCDSFP